MKILIAYDGAECSKNAIVELRLAGLPGDTAVEVVTITDVVIPAGFDADNLVDPKLPPDVQFARRLARDAMLDAKATADAGAEWVRRHFPDWNVSSQTLADSPAWGIVCRAAETKPDLIVVGSHNRGRLGRFFLGSASLKILGEADCSVRISRPMDAAPAAPVVLVAVDGSANSFTAVNAAKQRFWPPGTRMVLATVADKEMETSMLLEGTSFSGNDGQSSSAGDRIVQTLRQFTKDFSSLGVAAEFEFHAGNPKEMLIALAEKIGATTLMLGATGNRAKAGRRLGSIATAIATHAPCSVEIIRD